MTIINIKKVMYMVISDYYSSLTRKAKQPFIKKCCDVCDFSYMTFMYKMRNNSWTKLEQEAIEKLIKEGNRNVKPD